MDRWQWARDTWDREFAILTEAGYTLERVDGETYWANHERELRPHMPPEVFFRTAELRDQHERDGQARIAETRADNPLRDFCIVRRDGAIAAQFSGEQKSAELYRMWHTNVAPAFRRRGLYNLILRATIAYTRALGFDTIESEHAPCNNPVLIAKLKAAFRLFSLEIDPMTGPTVRLRYFHNPEHLALYELRCGMATLTPALAEHGFGGWTKLRDQMRR